MSKHTMNISLTPELEGIVHAYVRNGMYGNQSEVFRAALRLFHEKEQENEARLASLKREVGIGIRQVLSGEAEHVSVEEFKLSGRARLKDRG